MGLKWLKACQGFVVCSEGSGAMKRGLMVHAGLLSYVSQQPASVGGLQTEKKGPKALEPPHY